MSSKRYIRDSEKEFVGTMWFTQGLVLILSFLLGHLAQGSPADPASRKHCPFLPTKPDFSMDKFVGRWYQISEYNNHVPGTETCTYAEYGLEEDTGNITVYNNAVTSNGNVIEICGLAWCQNQDDPAKCSLYFPDIGRVDDFWILDTDYKKWAAIYSCSELIWGLFRVQFGWILGREPHMSDETLSEAYAVFENLGFDTSEFIRTSHPDSCSYEKPDPSCQDQ